MDIVSKQTTFALNVAKLITFIYEKGFAVTFGEALRTPEQAMRYAKQGKGIINSLHCSKLAIDLNLFDSAHNYCTEKASYEQFGTYWKSLHPSNRWGGDFHRLVDSNHFEMQDN